MMAHESVARFALPFVGAALTPICLFAAHMYCLLFHCFWQLCSLVSLVLSGYVSTFSIYPSPCGLTKQVTLLPCYWPAGSYLGWYSISSLRRVFCMWMWDADSRRRPPLTVFTLI